MSVVDFHTHILPGIDDGSASAEESIAMLRQEERQGIQHIVATPHFYADRDTPERFLSRRQAAAQQLREAIGRQQWSLLPQLRLGAEVYYFRGISEWDALEELSIEGTSCILIEMPSPPWTEQMYRELERIAFHRGLTPIIAHIDRYIAPLRTYGIPNRLRKLPVLVQANSSFFLHPNTRRMALRMLKRGEIHLLGSDCHDLTDRAPNLQRAIQVIQRKPDSNIFQSVEHYQARVLDGKDPLW